MYIYIYIYTSSPLSTWCFCGNSCTRAHDAQVHDFQQRRGSNN